MWGVKNGEINWGGGGWGFFEFFLEMNMFVRVLNLQNVVFLTIWCHFDVILQITQPNVSRV